MINFRAYLASVVPLVFIFSYAARPIEGGGIA
jgi:hypothetical protein